MELLPQDGRLEQASQIMNALDADVLLLQEYSQERVLRDDYCTESKTYTAKPGVTDTKCVAIVMHAR